MAITALMVDTFMPPSTSYGGIVVSNASLGDDVTVLGLCDDGTMLAVLCLDFDKLLTWLRTDSLFQRIEKLKQRSEWAYVYLVGSARPDAQGLAIINGHATKWSWNAIQGAIISMQELGIIVGYVADEAQFGEAVQLLGKRQRTTKRHKALRNFETYSPCEEMLLALPGIGEKLMIELVQSYGNFLWALMGLTDPDIKTPGIGEKSKAAIRNALGLKTDEQIAVVSSDVEWRLKDTVKDKAA